MSCRIPEVVPKEETILTQTTACQTNDLICQNCGCHVSNLLSEKNTYIRTDSVPISKVACNSAPILAADAILELEMTPELERSSDTTRPYMHTNTGDDAANVKEPNEIALEKDIIISLSPVDIDKRPLKVVSDSAEKSQQDTGELCNGAEGMTVFLSDSSIKLDVICSMVEEVNAEKSDPISPCVIQTRSRTAQKGKAK